MSHHTHDPDVVRDARVSRTAEAVVVALIFMTMLSGTLLIPAVRPLFAVLHPGHEGAVHAFFSLNMLGACIGAPLFSWIADRTGQRRLLVVMLALADGALLLLSASSLPLPLVFVLRALQGAANVGLLSILMATSSAKTRDVHGRGMGARGMAIVCAIAVGSPVGGALLSLAPVAPFWFAAGCAFATAAVGFVTVVDGAVTRRAHGFARLLRSPGFLRLPTLWIGVERFTVGCFVVTFSLYAHRVFGYSDADTGFLFALFLVPFAAFTWPVARVARGLDRSLVMGIGALGYGAAFWMLGSGFGGGAVVPVLILAGVSSAAIYAPSLCLAASLAPPELRATAMGVTNAAGTFGMLAGTAFAGICSAVLRDEGFAFADACAWVFRVAGTAPLLLVVVSVPVLLRHRVLIGATA